MKAEEIGATRGPHQGSSGDHRHQLGMGEHGLPGAQGMAQDPLVGVGDEVGFVPANARQGVVGQQIDDGGPALEHLVHRQLGNVEALGKRTQRVAVEPTLVEDVPRGGQHRGLIE